MLYGSSNPWDVNRCSVRKQVEREKERRRRNVGEGRGGEQVNRFSGRITLGNGNEQIDPRMGLWSWNSQYLYMPKCPAIREGLGHCPMCFYACFSGTWTSQWEIRTMYKLQPVDPLWPKPVFVNKVFVLFCFLFLYWNTAIVNSLHIVSGCFHTTGADVNSSERDHIATEPKIFTGRPI